MATTIKLKNGSGAPLAGDLVQGEPALDLTNKRLYTEDSGGTVIEVGTNPSTLTVDTDVLVVDATNNRVGIGTTSPARNLSVVDASAPHIQLATSADQAASNGFEIAFDGSANYIAGRENVPTLFYTNNTERMRIDSSGDIRLTGTAPNAEDSISTVNFYNSSSSLNLASITGKRTAGGTNYGSLIFNTTSAGSIAERMRIDSSGNLLVGKTSTAFGTAGVEASAGNGLWSTRSGLPALALNRLSTDGSIADFYKDGTAVGSIKCRSSGGNLQIDTVQSGIDFAGDGWLPMRNGSIVDNDLDLGSSSFRFSDLYLSGGVYLGGTGAANHLDDYEEGTWTPTISTGTASFSNATYTKVGRVVVVTVFFTSVSDQSSATALQVGNLPFTSDSNTFSTSTGLSRHFNRGDGTIVTYMGGNNNVINFYALDLGADYLAVRHQDLNNASANYYATITYIAA